MKNLYEAIKVVLSSSKSYRGSTEECRMLSQQLPLGERCASAVNFAVENPALGMSVNILECGIRRDDGTEYTQGVITSQGNLVYKYFEFDDEFMDVSVDVDGPWKKHLMIVADRIGNA